MSERTSEPAVGNKLVRKGSLEKNPRLSQWLRIHRDGTISIFSGKVELGQGILTALAQIAAEEFDVDPARIRMVAADTARSPDEGVTSGSLSIQDSGAALRHTCAEARALLLARAAERLAAPIAALAVADGTIRAGSRSTSFWELADDALFEREIAAMTAVLKPAREYRVVGSSAPRLDLPDKIAGRPRFIQDMAPPGMLFGRVVRPPHGFARLASFDDAGAKRIPGVISVVRDGGFVGVLAEREEIAISAMRKLRESCTWEKLPPLPRDIHAWLRQHAAEHRAISEKSDPAALERAA